ncbi:MAG: DNA gyrase subunit A [Proteobacteria bacterium]|nr:DNA gyrase subunit A [Pseudomonadota bacterium]
MESSVALTEINIEEEMRQSYLDYAMSVIIGRALPDVRDGLKPVQRRVLYAMFSEGLASDKKHSKCAGVVGEVLKRFHPHGDMPVYEALVRLAQPWTLRYPLVDGQGNFGSIDGDPPAAYRYTESRMTALAEELLKDIEKDTVDFIPNFDGSTEEPVVLPSVVPNLLVNGSDGIAVGMATHIPPHNLREVVGAAIALIENPHITLPELMRHVPGPDFPTGGIIHGRQGIVSAYATGKGVVQVRGKTHIETLKGRSREVEAIIITEIPFQLNKSRLLERTAELVNEKAIEGISDIRDESDRAGMRIVLELKRDATAEVVLNQLFKLTPLQGSFGIINLAIVDGKPVTCSLAELLSHFVDHRREVVTRRTQFELRKAEERMHLLEGFKIALLNLDEVIQLIKSSPTPAEARAGLVAKYQLSEIQAQAILELRLQKLTGMERLAIEQEHAELAKEIDRLKAILANTKKVDEIIVAELGDVRERFGDERRTEITEESVEFSAEDLIEDEEMVVTVSHEGYVKRTPASQYRAQRRGGKGITGAAQKESDFVEHLFVASSLADVMVFTNKGRMYWLKVYEIPEAGRAARGRALVNLLNLKDGEEGITAILPVRKLDENKFVVMATRQGVIKKVELQDFTKSRRNGIIACTLKENDSLIGVGISNGSDDVLLGTKDGMSIRFSEDEVRAMGRGAAGVRGIRLEGADEVVGMTIVPQAVPSTGVLETGRSPEAGGAASETEAGRTLLTVCVNGYGKRTAISDYRVQGRGGKGIIDIQTDERNGSVVTVCGVSDESEMMLITSSGKIIRFKAKDLSIIGRNTKGVRLIDLEGDEKVVAVAHLAEEEGQAEG